MQTLGMKVALVWALLGPPAHAGDGVWEWNTLGTVGGPPIHAEGAQIANALVVNGQTYLFDVRKTLFGRWPRPSLPCLRCAGFS